MVKLWLHEASRVYGDKLIEEKDMVSYAKIKHEIVKSSFEVSTHAERIHTHQYIRQDRQDLGFLEPFCVSLTQLD